MSDPYYSSVSLLLHCDGTNGSTTFTDSGPLSKVVTPTGCTISTTKSKFGGSSLVCGISNSYLSNDGSSAFAFGTGDFTMEFWYNPNGASAALMGAGLYSSISPTILLGNNFSGVLELDVSGGIVIAGATTLTTGTWYFIALSRVSGVTRLFLNGTQEGPSHTDTNSYVTNSNCPIIGGFTSALGNLGGNGYFDDIRITKGVGRYTSNFTPPTAAFDNSGSSVVNTSITGNIPVALSLASTMVYQHHTAIVGNIAVSLSLASTMTVVSHNNSIVGNLPIALSLSSSMNYHPSNHYVLPLPYSLLGVGESMQNYPPYHWNTFFQYSLDGQAWEFFDLTTISPTYTLNTIPSVADNVSSIATNGTITVATCYAESGNYFACNIVVSTDNGKTWAQITYPVGFLPTTFGAGVPTVTCNGTAFLIVGPTSNIGIESLDGVNWYITTLPNSYSWNQTAWNGHAWIAIGNPQVFGGYESAVATVARTTSVSAIDGTWTSITIPNSILFAQIAVLNGNFYIRGYDSGGTCYGLLSTDNGLTWTNHSPPTAANSNYYFACNGEALAINSNPYQYYITTDGITWTLHTYIDHILIGINQGVGNGAGFAPLSGIFSAQDVDTNKMLLSTDNGNTWFVDNSITQGALAPGTITTLYPHLPGFLTSIPLTSRMPVSLTINSTMTYMTYMSGASIFPALTQQGGASLSSVIGQSTLHPLTSIGYCGAIGASTFKALKSTGEGTGNQLMSGSSLFPRLKSSGTGSVMMTAFGSSTFKALTSIGQSGAIGASTFPSLTASGTATVYFTLSGASLFPALCSSGTGILRPNLTGGSLFPYLASPNTAQGSSIFASLASFGVSLAVANNSVAYVLNIHTGESTTYSNMNFMHIIPIGEKYYFVAPDGLYEWTGDTDGGVAINGTIITKESDMGSAISKRVQNIYLNSDTQTKTTPFVDGDQKTGQLSGFSGRRVVLGLGPVGRYHKFKIEGIKELTGLEIMAIDTSRKVK